MNYNLSIMQFGDSFYIPHKYRIMVKFYIFLLSIVFSTLQMNFLMGQGCSDAGFCTINSFKPNGGVSNMDLTNQFKIGTFYGQADHAISVFGGYIEYNKQLGKKLGVDAKLTTIAQSGNGISTFGISDIFINANYAASDKLRFTLGAKIPLTQANKSKDNLPLPMDYQSSLGTFDLIVGLGYEVYKFQLVAAIQQPLSQNDNQFLATKYSINSPLRAFQSTNQLERSSDILWRISYPIYSGTKIKLTPSLLPIHHLKDDKYTDESNIKKDIVGSKGLTLNANMYLDYEFNQKNALQINVGMPLIVRDARPDGLTRSVIINLEFRSKF